MPADLEGVSVKELQGTHALIEAVPRSFLLLDKIDLKLTDLFGAENFGRASEERGKLCHVPGVTLDDREL